MDEITTTGVTKVAALDKGSVSTFTIHPEDANLELVSPKQLKGGLPRQNAIALENLLRGEKGPIAISFYLIPQLPSSSRKKLMTLKEGVELAAEMIDTGQAKQKLDQLVSITAHTG